MKKSELKQIIKEEIHSIINEGKHYDENGRPISSGSIYDIGQTVNGHSKFIIWWEKGKPKFYYYDGDWKREYEYDNLDLLKTIENVDGLDNIKYLGNFND